MERFGLVGPLILKTFSRNLAWKIADLLLPLWICTATEMILTIEMIPATEMTPNHHRNNTCSQSK